MDKKIIIFLSVLFAIIILAFVYNKIHKQSTITTKKTVVVKKPTYKKQNYGYVPPPMYNPYKAQYY